MARRRDEPARRRRSWAGRTGLLALALTLGLAGCTESASPDATPTPTVPTSPSGPAEKSEITFGVWGSPAEISAYEIVVEAFNESSETATVQIQPFPSHAALVEALESDEIPDPDVYVVDRWDLPLLREKKLNRPVDQILDERAVDVGDGYSRDALEAFAAERSLQCMPYGISPMVIYYNSELLNLDRLARRDVISPEDGDLRWTLEEFSEAARFASRPRRGIRGLHIDATLRGLAPFLWSGGGSVFDDDETPTSLAFSSEESRAALQRTLELLRDPQVNLSPRQLARRSPEEWFARGKVAMIAGFRSLTPELRAVPGLDFGVLPMPVLDTAATVGDISGVCLSAEAASPTDAADFLVHVISAESVTRVTRSGYLAPANQAVALSEDYLQPGRLPHHAEVFVESVRPIVIPPLISDGPTLEAAVSPMLSQLLNVTILDQARIEQITSAIDAASQEVIAPELVEESSEPPAEETPAP